MSDLPKDKESKVEVAKRNSRHLRGGIAETLASDATHFEEAIAFTRNSGFRPELAEACAFYAEMLLERDEPGDQDKAGALLDESLAISTELGMRPLMERVQSRRELLGA